MCDNVARDKVVCVCVRERGCVAKMVCNKDVCDKVVCVCVTKLGVTKMCENDVC